MSLFHLCKTEGRGPAKKKFFWNVARGSFVGRTQRKHRRWDRQCRVPPNASKWNVLTFSGLGTGSLYGNFGHLLFKFDDSLLLTAHQVLEGFDFFQDLLELGFRLLWETQETNETVYHNTCCEQARDCSNIWTVAQNIGIDISCLGLCMPCGRARYSEGCGPWLQSRTAERRTGWVPGVGCVVGEVLQDAQQQSPQFVGQRVGWTRSTNYLTRTCSNLLCL